jgi:hypothetical protein
MFITFEVDAVNENLTTRLIAPEITDNSRPSNRISDGAKVAWDYIKYTILNPKLIIHHCIFPLPKTAAHFSCTIPLKLIHLILRASGFERTLVCSISSSSDRACDTSIGRRYYARSLYRALRQRLIPIRSNVVNTVYRYFGSEVL